MSNPEYSINKSIAIEAFDSADGPITESMIELVAAVLTKTNNSKDVILDAEAIIDTNSCTLNKEIINSRDYRYNTLFNYDFLPLNNEKYTSISGIVQITDDCSSIESNFSSITADFDFHGDGYVDNISFNINNRGISKINVNGINMTDELKVYIETQSAKYMSISKCVISANL